MFGFRFRYVAPILGISTCLVALCTITAVSLFSQQSAIAGVLRENVRSQRTAIELEECLLDLIALEDDRVESVAVLHDRVRRLLAEVRDAADQPEERNLHGRMSVAFEDYLRRWRAMPPPSDAGHDDARRAATRFLEASVLKPCQEFEQYNTLRVEQSASHHELVLRQLAWGLAGIGVLGGVAGLLLGFGVARGLARSIRRLQVQVRDAAGKLGPDLPEIVLTEDGDFGRLHADIDRLSERIEQVVRDLQEREREVLRAEQFAAVGQLAAGVAHEIRNPLTAIKMLVQAGQEDAAGMAGEDLRVIESEIRRMEHSLNTFLEFARPPKLQRQRASLNAIVEDMFGLVRSRAEKQAVALRIAAPPEPVLATADPEQLRQVIVNLGLNALDAMPTGGALRVILKAHPRAVEIEVADTGPGIGKAIFPRLFQPFASTKDTGLGLGLVISKRIIEDHGGTLNAANRSDGGASFFVRLPTEAGDG